MLKLNSFWDAWFWNPTTATCSLVFDRFFLFDALGEPAMVEAKSFEEEKFQNQCLNRKQKTD
jgi:hypothetical protein